MADGGEPGVGEAKQMRLDGQSEVEGVSRVFHSSHANVNFDKIIASVTPPQLLDLWWM